MLVFLLRMHNLGGLLIVQGVHFLFSRQYGYLNALIIPIIIMPSRVSAHPIQKNGDYAPPRLRAYSSILKTNKPLIVAHWHLLRNLIWLRNKGR